MALSSQQRGSPFLGPWCPTVGIKLQTDMYPMNPSRGDPHFLVPGAPLSGSNYRLTCTQWTPAEGIPISGSLVPHCGDQTTDWHVPNEPQQSGSSFLGLQYPTVRIKLQTDGYPANTSRVDLHFWVPSTHLSGSNYRLMGTQPTPAKWISISGSPVPNCQDQTTDWWVPSQHQQSESPFLGPWCPTTGIKLQTDRYPATLTILVDQQGLSQSSGLLFLLSLRCNLVTNNSTCETEQFSRLGSSEHIVHRTYCSILSTEHIVQTKPGYNDEHTDSTPPPPPQQSFVTRGGKWWNNINTKIIIHRYVKTFAGWFVQGSRARFAVVLNCMWHHLVCFHMTWKSKLLSMQWNLQKDHIPSADITPTSNHRSGILWSYHPTASWTSSLYD